MNFLKRLFLNACPRLSVNLFFAAAYGISGIFLRKDADMTPEATPAIKIMVNPNVLPFGNMSRKKPAARVAKRLARAVMRFLLLKYSPLMLSGTMSAIHEAHAGPVNAPIIVANVTRSMSIVMSGKRKGRNATGSHKSFDTRADMMTIFFL